MQTFSYKNALLYCFFLFLGFSSCKITLKNTYIDYNVYKTASVEQFETTAANAPPSAAQQFSEQLKLKILSDTRLQYVEGQGDVAFSGALTRYEVTSIAPQGTDNSAFQQRLTITFSISRKDNKDPLPAKSWEGNTFTRFANFPADADLSSVQDQLITEIYEQILEDVFNKSFTGW
jgi:hypothetical protein